MTLRYAPTQKRIYTKQELEELFGNKDKDLVFFANAATGVLADPNESLDNVIKSLQIVISDLEFRRDRKAGR